jgi:hypothetical protein
MAWWSCLSGNRNILIQPQMKTDIDQKEVTPPPGNSVGFSPKRGIKFYAASEFTTFGVGINFSLYSWEFFRANLHLFFFHFTLVVHK